MTDLGIPGYGEAVEVGRGGFGTVYRSHQAEFNRVVAVKVLSTQRLDEVQQARFRREREAMGHLSGHPNIVTVFSGGVTGQGQPYIVMEYLPGGSIGMRLETTGPMAWPEVVELGIKLAGALETAHRGGIVHRDVKPENVLISKYGEPKLTDFGIAHVVGQMETRSGTNLTILHAPPELLDGGPATEVSDVYAMASTLYTLLLGRAPFIHHSSDTIYSVIQRISNESPPDLRALGVPESVGEVLRTAMEKDPQGRPASALDFAHQLQAAQNAEGVVGTTAIVDDLAADHARDVGTAAPSAAAESRGRVERASSRHPPAAEPARAAASPVYDVGASQRALSPVLIGREEELARLVEALRAANDGAGQFAVLSGEAGVGKTRLALRLGESARRMGMTVLRGGCSEADLALPYLPIVEALGNYLDGANLRSIRRLLGSAARELAQLFPQLGAGAMHDILDPSQGKLRLFEAFLSLLRIAAGSGGLLLVVEDFHWADASTREFLAYMSRRLRGTRTLVVVTLRRDEVTRQHPLTATLQGWQRSGAAEIVELRALPPDGVASMIGSIFGDLDVTDEFRDLMFSRTEGNPFFLEEILKDAIERGDIYRTADGWERRALKDLNLPSTVSDTILARFERLSDDHADILRCAAVLGRSFTPGLVAETSGQEPDEVGDALKAACQQQLIEVVGETGQYRFRHALSREAVYQDIPAPGRERLHSSAADALSQRAGPTVDLALHLLAGSRFAEAVPACLRAADEARAHSGYREAVDLYQRALPHTSSASQHADVLGRIGEALWSDGDSVAAVPYLSDGIQILEHVADRTVEAHLRLVLGRCYFEQMEFEAAREEYAKALSLLEALGTSEDLAMAYARLAGLAVNNVDHQLALQFSRQAIEVAVAAHTEAPRILASNYVGMSMARLGDVAEGFEWLERSYREARGCGLFDLAALVLNNAMSTNMELMRTRDNVRLARLHRALPGDGSRQRAWAYANESATMYYLGEFGLAWSAATAGMKLAQELEFTLVMTICRSGQSALLVEAGELDRAIALAPEPDKKNGEGALTEVWVAQTIRLARGDLDGALQVAELALELQSGLMLEPWALDITIQVLIATGQTDRARKLIDFIGSSPIPGPDAPMYKRSVARVLSAEGDHQDAARLARESADDLAARGLKPDALRSRLVLAQSLRLSGSDVTAEAELRFVFDEAKAIGSVCCARLASAALQELGFESDVSGLSADWLSDSTAIVAKQHDHVQVSDPHDRLTGQVDT